MTQSLWVHSHTKIDRNFNYFQKKLEKDPMSLDPKLEKVSVLLQSVNPSTGTHLNAFSKPKHSNWNIPPPPDSHSYDGKHFFFNDNGLNKITLRVSKGRLEVLFICKEISSIVLSRILSWRKSTRTGSWVRSWCSLNIKKKSIMVDIFVAKDLTYENLCISNLFLLLLP